MKVLINVINNRKTYYKKLTHIQLKLEILNHLRNIMTKYEIKKLRL